MEESPGKIEIRGKKKGNFYELTISDEGKGISQTEKIFVSFYTTKKKGSGIGLVLSRQTMEAHEGSIRLENRDDKRGVWLL